MYDGGCGDGDGPYLLPASCAARGLVLSSTCKHLANISTVGIVHMIAGFSSFKYVMVMVMTVPGDEDDGRWQILVVVAALPSSRFYLTRVVEGSSSLFSTKSRKTHCWTAGSCFYSKGAVSMSNIYDDDVYTSTFTSDLHSPSRLLFR